MLWDKAAQRWLLTQFAVTGGPPFFECASQFPPLRMQPGPLNRHTYCNSTALMIIPRSVCGPMPITSRIIFSTRVVISRMPKSVLWSGAKVIAGALAFRSYALAMLTTSRCCPPTLMALPRRRRPVPPIILSTLFRILPGPSTTLNLFKFHVDWVTPGNLHVHRPDSHLRRALQSGLWRLGVGDCIPQPLIPRRSSSQAGIG